MARATQNPIENPPSTPLSAFLYHAQVLSAGGGFKVRPPVAHVNRRAEPFFRFKNNTDYPTQVLLPAAIIGGPDPVDIGPRSWVEIPLLTGGAFSYVVVVTTQDGKVSAPGESDPVIIIDPPA